MITTRQVSLDFNRLAMPTKQSVAKSTPRGVVTVMFTDIVDSSRLKSAMAGESSAARDANYHSQIKGPHDQLVLRCVAESGGHKVNSTGDGYCCTFADAEAAVQCALRLQNALNESPIEAPGGPLKLRIGLHTGHAEPLGGEYASSTLDVASRVQSRASGGEILVTRETQILVNRRLRGVRFVEAGSCDLKG